MYYMRIMNPSNKWDLSDTQLKEIESRCYGFEYKGYKFIAHHSDGHDGSWTITEVSTGFFVTHHPTNKKDAIEKAKIIIDKVGIERVRERITKILETYGKAN